MVYYRKYRPQHISDLDNEEVRETLLSVLAKEPPHAFLFTGPKGLGKTSTARIVAKAVNCTNKKKDSAEPCNECDQCTSITKGTNMDVIEIDAASNRGIDEIRELKEKIRLAPLAATTKVYIIDEVHMLTTEAFNALLKTLEEPPNHAMFILATTEPHKVPATILSRCLHISFHLATKEELVRSFQRILDGEGLSADKEALSMIADLAEGGFRDGAKLLEEIVAKSKGEKITVAVVEEKYQVSSISGFVSDLIDSLSKKDVKASIEIVGKLLEQGIDIKYFIQQLMHTLHTDLLTHIGIAHSKKKPALSVSEITYLFSLLAEANAAMKTAVLPQLPLELAIISWCERPVIARLEPQSSHDESMKQSQNVVMTKDDSGEVTVSTLRKQVGDIKKKEALYGVPKPAPAKQDETTSHTKIELMHASPNEEITPQWQAALWSSIIAEMKKYNHTIAGVLRGCVLKKYDRKVLIIEANFPFHKERLDDGKTRDALAKACKMLTGKDVQVTVELKH
jgi:DNA polymerase III subunit gamma/tau